jgi:hypothetical protein
MGCLCKLSLGIYEGQAKEALCLVAERLMNENYSRDFNKVVHVERIGVSKMWLIFVELR